MYPPTYLEWFYHGEWHTIGWTAFTPDSAKALREHGDKLAAHKPAAYRLVQPSAFIDSPPHVIHEWSRAVA